MNLSINLGSNRGGTAGAQPFPGEGSAPFPPLSPTTAQHTELPRGNCEAALKALPFSVLLLLFLSIDQKRLSVLLLWHLQGFWSLEKEQELSFGAASRRLRTTAKTDTGTVPPWWQYWTASQGSSNLKADFSMYWLILPHGFKKIPS